MANIENRVHTAKEWEDMGAKAESGTGEYFYVKANIPRTLAAYKRGKGDDIEGIWILIDSETHEEYRSHSSEGNFLALLCNESLFQPGLNDTAFDYDNETAKPFKFEHRGSNRPVLARTCLDKLLEKSKTRRKKQEPS